MDKNKTLLDIIAPMHLKFNRNNLILGENLAKIYAIIGYPSKTKIGWLSKLTNMTSTVASISFEPISSGEFISHLSKNIAVKRGDALSLTDPLQTQRAERAVEDGEKLLGKIDSEGEAIGLMSVCLMAMASEKDLFEQVCKKIEAGISIAKCRSRVLAFRQKQGLMAMSPSYTKNKSVSETSDRIVPLSALIGGFPFAASGYNDGAGYYLAKDTSGGLIIIDYWKRGGDRTNSNMVIMGQPGQGKSVTVKHLIVNEYMLGTKIIIIDPEREYKDLCANLKGDWINAAGGSKGKINPLQILPISKEDDKDDYEDSMPDMAVYLKHLEMFFKTYLPNLTDKQTAILNSELIELYNKFNIYFDTDINVLNNTDFPVISDLYNQLLDKDGQDYQDLALLLKNMAVGSDSLLWNGHTTLHSDSNLIVLDTHDLQQSSDRVIRTEYLMLTTWMWREISRDRKEKVIGIFDEAYLLIDKNVPQTLAFLRNGAKRCRKYEGAFVIITHSVIDFLDPSVKMYGQALLDTPCLKFLMGCDGENLRQTKVLYNLTDAEEELLLSQQRSKGLLLIGSKRLQATINIPTYEWEYIGQSGGR